MSTDYSIRDENGNVVFPGLRLEVSYTYEAADLLCEECGVKMDFKENTGRLCPKCGKRMALFARDIKLMGISMVSMRDGENGGR